MNGDSVGVNRNTGHFTQMIWAASKHLGVGFKKAANGENTYLVARYEPAGNMAGNYKENVLPKGS